MVSNILKIVEDHEKYRQGTLNLQASENVLSPDVRKALSSDLNSRYSLMLDGENAYGGTKYSEQILEDTENLAKEVFKSKYAEVRALGGHIAAEIVIVSLIKRRESILALAEKDGGYTGYSQNYLPSMFSFLSYNIPYNNEAQEINFEKLEGTMKEVNPRMIMLGQSFFVKHYDLVKLRKIADDYNAYLAYDASHVMGLLGGGAFQPDALEQCDVVFGSTHKTFFGPQGGIILTNDEKIHRRILENLTWKTIDNFHISRVAGLGVALEEMKKHGKKYAEQVIKNSKAMGENLSRLGVPVRFSPWYSETHQVHLDANRMKEEGTNFTEFGKRLEKNGIIADKEGRIGTAEITRMGVTDTGKIAEVVADASRDFDVKERVQEIVKDLKMKFWG